MTITQKSAQDNNLHFMHKITALGVSKDTRRTFWVLVLFSAFINLFMLTVPIYMLQIYDRVLTSQSLETLAVLTILAFGLLAVMAILDICRSQILSRLSARFDLQVSKKLMAAFLTLPRSAAKKEDSRTLQDLESLKRFISSPAFVLLFDAPWSPFYLLILFLIHPIFGLVSLIAASLLLLFAYLSDYLTKGRLSATSEQLAKTRLLAQSAIQSPDVVIAMGMTESLSARYQSESLQGLVQQTKNADLTSVAGASSRFIRLFAQIAILGFGAWLVIEQQITAGIMIAASLIMSRALAPFERLLGSWQGFLMSRQAFNRLAKFLHDDARQKTSLLPCSKGTSWQLKQVGVQFPGSHQLAIRDISFDITPAQAIGIIGPNSAGKSTLARVLAGALRPTEGHLYIDETNAKMLSAADYSRHVGFMPQDIQLLEATVYENIARFQDDKLEEAIKVARITGIHDLILDLPDGYDTQLGRAGTRLSGGQSQLLALARAIYGEPSLVVLDEPNAYLDSSGEKSLASALNYCREIKAAIVIISHKPHIMEQLDYLYVLRDGQIEFSGRPDEVHKKVMRKSRGPGAIKQ